jgi:hypothetical protein
MTPNPHFLKNIFLCHMKTTSNISLKKTVLCLLPLILSLATACSAEVTGPYFGQKPPGKTPKIFAPGILSLTNRMEARIAFSPDGNECFFTVPQDFKFSCVKLYYTKRVNNVWTPQEGVREFGIIHFLGGR